MANLSENIPALKFKKVNADIGGSGSAGSPSYLKLVDLDGVARYLFIETDGTVKVHTAVPTADANGDVVGAQT